MRLLVYNIRYATGTGPSFHLPLPGAGYLRSNRKVLAGITEFIRDEHPDMSIVMLTVVGGIAYVGVILVERRVLHYLPARAVGGNLLHRVCGEDRQCGGAAGHLRLQWRPCF